ncbi:glycosyltransferase, partial [Candidatus Zixiibacteriota bacterium]
MDASIVIPTYNKLSYLRATLRSLQTLDYPQNSFEVVVVDDGSQDGTGNFLSAGHFDFRFKTVSHKTNQGRSAARNSGLRLAKGRVVVFLDDDMSVVPEFLHAHLHEHDQVSKRVVLGNVCSTAEVTRTALIQYLDSRGVHKLKKGQQVPFRYFATGNVSAERDLLLAGGLFDERFKEFGGEDLELGYRLHKIGAEFAYAPRARSYRSDYGDISQLCRRMMTYGRQSLPILIR